MEAISRPPTQAKVAAEEIVSTTVLASGFYHSGGAEREVPGAANFRIEMPFSMRSRVTEDRQNYIVCR
jgi:hypothetical protein